MIGCSYDTVLARKWLFQCTQLAFTIQQNFQIVHRQIPQVVTSSSYHNEWSRGPSQVVLDLNVLPSPSSVFSASCNGTSLKALPVYLIGDIKVAQNK